MSYIMTFGEATVRVEEHDQTVVDRLSKGWLGWVLDIDQEGTPHVGVQLYLGEQRKVSETHSRELIAGAEVVGEGKITLETDEGMEGHLDDH